MNTERICPNCRKTLAPDVPLGLCPEYLIKSGFPTDVPIGSMPVAAATAVAAAARFVPPPVSEIAALFPQLEILGLIGQGGMGAVYKARQPALDRLVALKVLPPAMGSDPGFAERFNREARALARLNHPNIVAVHDFGQAGPLHYLLMEFVDGANLREIEQAGKLSPEQAVGIVPQICEALQFAHNEGIVHRDIKPENLLLDKKGRLKITDFGIAKIIGVPTGKSALTGARDVMGTPHYMAPEQIENPQAVDHRADIYSLGVVFYEMLTGELPLGRFPLPSQKAPVDARLDDVVMHTLEKSPEQRYQQASQVKKDVETIATTTAPSAPTPKPSGKAGTLPSGSPIPPFSGLSTPPATPHDANVSDKLILPAFLLAFFFGVFGAHRFYVGKIGTAILQAAGFFGSIVLIVLVAIVARVTHMMSIFFAPVIVFLGPMIVAITVWATIDWILILCKVFTDGRGRRLTKWFHSDPVMASQTPLRPTASEAAGTSATSGTPGFGSDPAGTSASGTAAGGAGTPPPPLSGSGPFGAGGPFGQNNPFGNAKPVSQGMIAAPAIGLLVAGGLKLFGAFQALFVVSPFNSFFHQFFPELSFNPFEQIVGMSAILFSMVPAILIIVGGCEMLRQRSYPWAVAAAIIAIVACSLVGLPVGIWALIVLLQPGVREKFSKDPALLAPLKCLIISAVVVLGVTLVIFAGNFFPHTSRGWSSGFPRVGSHTVNFQPTPFTMPAPAMPVMPTPPTPPTPPVPATPATPALPAMAVIGPQSIAVGDQAHFSATFAASPGGRLNVNVDRGDIRVIVADQDNVAVKLDREVTRASPADAAGILLQEAVTITQDNSQITITGQEPPGLHPHSLWGLATLPNLNAHYEITVPRKFDVQLQTSGGNEQVSGLQGKLKLGTSGGSLECKDITGDVNGQTSGGDILADNCNGELRLQTSGGSVNITGFNGPHVHASTSGGNVSVDFAVIPKFDCDLETSGGNITAHLPATAAFDVDAHTSGGSVRTDFAVQVDGQIKDGTLKGPINGGGSNLKLKTSGGDIELLKR